MRRTSLPAISVQRPPLSSQGIGHASNTVDSALLSEAHGIVSEMLHDPHLPPTVLSGLQALHQLLAPTNAGRNSPAPRSPRPTPHNISLNQDASGSGSDSEENPYIGEKASVQKKLSKRGVSAHLLRRMSTSTWTTTTSATGMPTLEPQPNSRRRATSFRGIGDLTPGSSPSHGSKLEASIEQFRCYTNSMGKSSALSRNINRDRGLTHSPGRHCDTYRGSDPYECRGKRPGLVDRFSRFQSLHSQPVHEPLTEVHSVEKIESPCDNDDSESSSRVLPGCVKEENIQDNGRRLNNDLKNKFISTSVPKNITSSAEDQNHIRKKIGPRHATSDYESSGSPSSTETGEDGHKHRLRTSEGGKRAASLENELPPTPPEEANRETTQESYKTKVSSTTDSGIKILIPQPRQSLGDQPNTSAPSREAPQSCMETDEEKPRMVHLPNGSLYELEELASDPLLARIAEWDYPIFELANSSNKQCLSRLCYKVFSEIGLFETFRIPLKNFLNYFNCLERGYREIPYHNCIHAADVLQCVYYFTSQPIPGFSPPPDSAFSGPEGGAVSQLPCQRFNTQDSYGIMGAHLPALELMALYTAAAMHDYDHPGRTNAFLVTTNAPQAVLYNDRSVLENHHAAAAWSLFLSNPEFNFLTHLDRAEFKRFRFLVIESILATDLKRHFEILAEFNAKANEVEAPGIDWNAETDRLLVLETCIKLADINGPCKELILHRDWTFRIAEEFYEQGDEEARLGLPISPYMDRRYPQLAKLQESFINHLVAPLCNAYSQAGLMPGSWMDEDTEGPLRSEEEEDTSPDDASGSASDEDADSMSSDSSGPQNLKRKCYPRKIFCIHTEHIQENHNYWVNKIKEEQRLIEEASLSDKVDVQEEIKESPPEERPVSLNLSTTDQPMEPIEEEKTPVSISSSHSFTFVSFASVRRVTSYILKVFGGLFQCIRPAKTAQQIVNDKKEKEESKL